MGQAFVEKELKPPGKVIWLNFEQQNHYKYVTEFWADISQEIKNHKIDIVMEDPPLETVEFGNQQGLRAMLGDKAKLADDLDVGWFITRNFSKTETKQLLDKVGGFALWTNIPRCCLFSFKADKNSFILHYSAPSRV